MKTAATMPQSDTSEAEVTQREETYENGDRYIGEFENNLRQGFGTMIFAAGGEYTGQWHAGKKKGLAEECYANGDRYEGEFDNDERHGHGIFTYTATGTICSG